MTAHQFTKLRRQIEHMGKEREMAPVRQILVLQQIKLEKNGFQPLVEWFPNCPLRNGWHQDQHI